MTNFPLITIIGAGNMGNALISGLIQHGHPCNKLYACDPSWEKLQHLQNTFNIATSCNNQEGTAIADVIILAVKPQFMIEVIKELKQELTGTKKPLPIIISIAAGVTLKDIRSHLGELTVSIVRAMPNITAIVGKAATALYADTDISPRSHDWAEYIMGAVGIVKWLPTEELMNTVTALSGSGPAYFFLIMEALEKSAINLGLPADIAHLFIIQTMLGAAEFAFKTFLPFSTLIDQVTSKGGTTEKALMVLKENNIENLLKNTLQAAKLRAQELSLENSN